MSVQNFSFLARLEVAEKFVVVGWGWSRPSLGFSFLVKLNKMLKAVKIFDKTAFWDQEGLKMIAY